jgi:hypothetical protein
VAIGFVQRMTKTETVIGKPRSFMALSGNRGTAAQAQRLPVCFCCAGAAPARRHPGTNRMLFRRRDRLMQFSWWETRRP